MYKLNNQHFDDNGVDLLYPHKNNIAVTSHDQQKNMHFIYSSDLNANASDMFYGWTVTSRP